MADRASAPIAATNQSVPRPPPSQVKDRSAVGMFWPDRITGNVTWAVLDPAFQIFRLRGGVTDVNGAPIVGMGLPWLAISEIVDGSAARDPAFTLQFTRSGRFGHPSYGGGLTLGGYDLFTSASLPYLKGVLTRSNNELWFQPHADGIFNRDFVDRSEFQLMERGICVALHQGPFEQSFCGTVGLNGS